MKNNGQQNKNFLNNFSNYFNVCIIGAGRLGTTLAALLLILSVKNPKSNIRLKAVCSRTNNSIGKAKNFLYEAKEKFLNNFNNTYNSIFLSVSFSLNNIDGVSKSNVVFICTPDDEIKNVAKEIYDYNIQNSSTEKDIIKNKIFIHFSGAKTLNVLSYLKNSGGFIASLHPIKSFASIEDSVRTIFNTFYGVTYPKNCPEILKKFINDFVNLLEGKIIEVEDSKKSIYHAAACVASNYLVSLINYAVFLHHKISINEKDSIDGLIGLIEGTINNIKKLGTKKALTGPIARGDIGTIKQHIKSFKKYLKEEDYLVYKVLGVETANIAYQNGWIDNKILEKFKKIFSI